MASSSSSSRIKKYHVFPSFHGPDVRRGFLSHLHNHFASKGIITFKDNEIERGHTIGPELVQAIGESRVSIVVLSKKYASSSWCLDELVEILNCKEAQGQIVMTIFYDVDPSDVRKPSGVFRNVFEKTCQGKSEEVKQRWSKALAYVATIAGEHSVNWDDEAAMVEKIATDVSTKLNVTTLSRDSDGMVGMEAHLTKLNSLLCLERDQVKMIGIWGPAGIGKSTIARSLYNHLSSCFRFKCFLGNIKGSYKSIMGVDDHDSKLWLQNQLLSKILNQNNMKIHHLGAIKEWLQDQRVLIILDDVDDLEQLEVLAKEPSWFGHGSRIIVTTEDKKILKAHGINDIYHVDFPSMEEALEILCLSAFKQRSVRDGFEEVAYKVAELCGNLPLGLCVVGSSLRGESKHEWELQLSRIETNLDRKIEDILRVGYDRLSKKDQSLFLHIACFFNYRSVDYVTTMLADSNLDIENTMKSLVVKSLVHTDGWIGMHYLLQQLGRQIVAQQSGEPGKRQFLIEAEEIRDVLTNETGTGSVIGISFDMSKIGEFSISKRVFEGMRNLKFLKFYNGNVSLLEDMEYLPHLKLLHWDSYPRKSLPPTFQPERLVELHMSSSNLEKLWGGIQPLTNLKEMDLGHSKYLREIPDLSKATSLKTLTLTSCTSLLELPSSIRNLHNLKWLDASWCSKLKAIPTNINLASLEKVDMRYCSLLRTFPDISSNIETLNVTNTKIKDVPSSIAGRWSRCICLMIGNRNLTTLTDVPNKVTLLDLSNSDIRRIPDCVIGLSLLRNLSLENCRKLESIPSFSSWLNSLNANNCVSLKKVCLAFNDRFILLTFCNCLKLDEEARRRIIQQYVDWYACLPCKEIPTEFTHRAIGNSIIIPFSPCGEGTFSTSSRYRACFLLSTIEDYYEKSIGIVRSKGRVQVNIGYHFVRLSSDLAPKSRSEHLFMFGGGLFDKDYICLEDDDFKGEIVFEFSCKLLNGLEDCKECQVMECGVEISSEEAECSSSSSELGYSETGGNINHHSNEAVHTGHRIWSGEEDRTSIILGIVIVLCIFLIILIFREIGVSDPRCC